MSKSPPPIVYLGLVALLGAGGFYWYQQGGRIPQLPELPQFDSPQPNLSPPPQASALSTTIQATLPNPVVLNMDGSVTMVQLIKRLQNAYAQRYPNTPTTYGQPDGNPNGSNRGLQALIAGQVQMAATSRPLQPEEAEARLQVIPIARDALAVVVGVDNPFRGGLTVAQLKGIFQGRIRNWAEVGGPDLQIRVLNRSEDSGTRDLFRSTILLGEDFGSDGPNFITFERDVTTPILRALGQNGISYTTVSQADNQRTVRIVPLEGIAPTDRAAVQQGLYPASRSLFLAVPTPTSPAVKNFVDLALSPQGQQIAEQAGFIPLSGS